jgi:hypothetical protein
MPEAADAPEVHIEPLRTEREADAGPRLAWTARIDNTTPRTLHVSTEIQSIEVEPDGTVVRVSTERPVLASEVYVPFTGVATVPVQPGEALEQRFDIPVPLRLNRFTGELPRLETTEWMPAPEVEINLTIAFGNRPFYPPARREELARALDEWGQLVKVPPTTIRTDVHTTGDANGLD